MSDAPTLLRPAEPADRPFVRERFHEAAERTYPGLAALGRLSRKDRLDELFGREWEAGRTWVAWRGDRRMGMAMASAHEHPVTEAPEWVLSSIGVAPEARGQGVGQALLAEVRRAAEAEGVGQLRLFVAADNAPALKLYRSQGFVEGTVELVLPLR